MESRRGPGESPYGEVHTSTRAMILALGGMTIIQVDEMATELQVDYELFCADNTGSRFPDAYVGFSQMMRHWPAPWQIDDSSLNGLTLPQFLLVWAFNLNQIAKYFLDGQALAHDWTKDDAIQHGLIAAIGAAKSLAHAARLV